MVSFTSIASGRFIFHAVPKNSVVYRGAQLGWLVNKPLTNPVWYVKNKPKPRLIRPEASLNPRWMRGEVLPANAKGNAIAAVISIIPARVPTPNRRRYASAHLGLRIVVNTSRATAADPARPWTKPTTNGRTN